MSMNIKSAVLARLGSAHGWRIWQLPDNVVTKNFPTAVGLKQGTARITEDSFGKFWLTGEYLSEGRNAFATSYATFDARISATELTAKVDAFAAETKATIAETYAGRLLRVLAA